MSKLTGTQDITPLPPGTPRFLQGLDMARANFVAWTCRTPHQLTVGTMAIACYSFGDFLGTGEMIKSFLAGMPSLRASSGETLRNPLAA